MAKSPRIDGNINILWVNRQRWFIVLTIMNYNDCFPSFQHSPSARQAWTWPFLSFWVIAWHPPWLLQRGQRRPAMATRSLAHMRHARPFWSNRSVSGILVKSPKRHQKHQQLWDTRIPLCLLWKPWKSISSSINVWGHHSNWRAKGIECGFTSRR